MVQGSQKSGYRRPLQSLWRWIADLHDDQSAHAIICRRGGGQTAAHPAESPERPGQPAEGTDLERSPEYPGGGDAEQRPVEESRRQWPQRRGYPQDILSAYPDESLRLE